MRRIKITKRGGRREKEDVERQRERMLCLIGIGRMGDGDREVSGRLEKEGSVNLC